jgi:hypothetical protein
MLTVRRTHPQIHEMTRNSSLFKLKRFGEFEKGGIRTDPDLMLPIDVPAEPAGTELVPTVDLFQEEGEGTAMVAQADAAAVTDSDNAKKTTGPSGLSSPDQQREGLEQQEPVPVAQEQAPVNVEAEQHQPAPAATGGKVGRPSAEESMAREVARQAKYEARRAINPPTRVSTRNRGAS